MDTKEQILTNELRNDLKEVIQKELRQLHEQMEALDQRVAYLARYYNKKSRKLRFNIYWILLRNIQRSSALQ